MCVSREVIAITQQEDGKEVVSLGFRRTNRSKGRVGAVG